MDGLAVRHGDLGKLGVTGAVSIALFIGYCRLHGALDGAQVPFDASLKWGLVAGGPAGLLAWATWRTRRRLARLASAGPTQIALLTLAFFATVTLGGSVLHQAMRAPSLDGLTAAGLFRTMFDLTPVAAALTVAIFVLARLSSIPPAALPVQPAPAQPVGAWLPLPEGAQLYLRAAEVHLVQAAGNYCEIHCGARVHLVRATLRHLQDLLRPFGFARVHRSRLVNLARVHSVAAADRRGQWVVRFDSGEVCPVGGSYRDGLAQALGATPGRPPGA